jgi:hypothetical protein
MISKKIFRNHVGVASTLHFFAGQFVPRVNVANGMYRKSSGLETIFRKNVVFTVIARTQLGAANKKGRSACGLE